MDSQPSASRSRKILRSAVVVGALGAIAAAGTFSAFSSTTSNDGNSFAAGTVYISDNDANAALYSLTNQKPGVTTEKCIKVTYTGSLDSDVRIYTDSTVNAFAQYVNLTITPGTQATSTFPDCTAFVADSGGAIYNGTLSNFASTKNSYDNGVSDYPGASATKWVTNDAVVYKVAVSVQDTNNANAGNASGYTSGSHKFIWEARSQ
jgi:predicted ribosomally synthesized peptide with SipW-like signal peptide